MNAKIEKLENNIVQVEITIEAERFEKALIKSFKKNANRFKLPGFRDGKAPLAMVKKAYGVEALYEDAVNLIFEETYPVVIKENNIQPIEYPKLDIVQIGEGKELIYTATVAVIPQVILGEYKGVEVTNVEYPVLEEAIEEQLIAMQQKGARVEIKDEDGEVLTGDIAVIDYKGFIDEVAFDGGEGKDFELEIGSGSFIDNFEDQLVGLKKGEFKEINVTFPEAYGKEDLNGKTARFEVTVNAIKYKELPNLDDEFAKEVSEFDTIEELKENLKSKLTETNKLRAEKEFEDKVVEVVCDNATVSIPNVMIVKETAVMLEDLAERLQFQGLDLKSYYEYTNTTEEKVREYMKDNAEKRVKTRLVLEQIANIEVVVATEEELLAKAMQYANQYGTKDIEKNAKLMVKAQATYLAMDVINEKVVKMLVSNSKIEA